MVFLAALQGALGKEPGSFWLVFPSRLEVKEAVMSWQGMRRGWAHTHPSPSLLGLINISRPTFLFWEHFSLFRLQMHHRKLLGNSCSLNLLKTGSFLLISVCCSSSWFHSSPAVFSPTKLANHRRHPRVVFWNLPASSEQQEVN